MQYGTHEYPIPPRPEDRPEFLPLAALRLGRDRGIGREPMTGEVFVSSRVSTVFHRRLNLGIARVCEAHGYRPFLPQLELWDLEDDVAILEGNEAAVERAALAVVVLDRVGTGVSMELGQALALGREVIGLRLPQDRRCGRLKELDGLLSRLA